MQNNLKFPPQLWDLSSMNIEPKLQEQNTSLHDCSHYFQINFPLCQVMFESLIPQEDVTTFSLSLCAQCYVKHSCSSLQAGFRTTDQFYFGFFYNRQTGKSICGAQPVLKPGEIPTAAGQGMLGVGGGGGGLF